MRLAIATDCLLFDKYEQNHDRHVPEIHTNNVACIKVCHDQLCQMLRTGQAVLTKICPLSRPKWRVPYISRHNIQHPALGPDVKRMSYISRHNIPHPALGPDVKRVHYIPHHNIPHPALGPDMKVSYIPHHNISHPALGPDVMTALYLPP